MLILKQKKYSIFIHVKKRKKFFRRDENDLFLHERKIANKFESNFKKSKNLKILINEYFFVLK